MASLIKYKGKTPQVGERVFLAEGACLVGDVSVGDDSSIFYNAVLRGDLAEIKMNFTKPFGRTFTSQNSKLGLPKYSLQSKKSITTSAT